MADFAFPSGDFEGSFGPDERFRGISKRDYFAAKAMESLIPVMVSQKNLGDDCDLISEVDDNYYRNLIAKTAYLMADAMIEQD